MNKTDNEIIKALECCIAGGEDDCLLCPLHSKKHCIYEKDCAIADLINRQKEDLDIELNIINRQNDEIWQLKEEIKRLQNERKPNEGKWIEHYAFDVWHYDCPFCDDGYATKGRDTTPPNFCGNCGAKLSGVKSMEDNHD